MTNVGSSYKGALMRDGLTPTAYLFDELRQQAGISNRDAALILLSTRPIYAGRSPRDRIGERTFLSREVVHVTPNKINPAIYGDFSQSAQTITSRLAGIHGWGDKAHAQVISRYAGEAATNMVRMLDAYGREGRIYANTVMRVESLRLSRESDRAVLLVLAFVVAGCLADPRAVSEEVERFTREKLAREMGTLISDPTPRAQQTMFDGAPNLLGLVRVVSGSIRPPIYPLSQGPKGTVIGSIPSEGSSITDVEVDVSRQHLVVWHQDGGWWCQGLQSTNGTFLIRGTTKGLVRVEEPRSSRTTASVPVAISAGDTLCLGRRTRFLVIQMTS